MTIHEGTDSGLFQFWRNHMLPRKNISSMFVTNQLQRLDSLDFFKQLYILDSEMQFKRGSVYANALVDLR